jgi:hypothetical protein
MRMPDSFLLQKLSANGIRRGVHSLFDHIDCLAQLWLHCGLYLTRDLCAVGESEL